MGLPAFDMSAFEAAQSAFVPAPRAHTSIFMGPGVQAHAQEELHRRPLERSIAEYEKNTSEWRTRSMVGLGDMRRAMEAGLSAGTVSFARDLSAVLVERIRSFEEIYAQDEELDRRLQRIMLDAIQQAEVISVQSGKFLRRILKRIQETAKIRSDTRARVLAGFARAKEAADAFVGREALSPPAFSTDAERSSYLEHALQRAADVDGVKERAARRLKQFPKTAAYLAR